MEANLQPSSLPEEERRRLVMRVIEPRETVEGAGVHVLRSIGGPDLDYLDPFLLLDNFVGGDPAAFEAGFPEHPHKGIETVTYLIDGEMRHRDDQGNEGVVGPGAVQWMTAGRGVVHDEMPRPHDGHIDGLQLWINLPARDKLVPPSYQNIAAEQIPVHESHSGVVTRVIAGRAGAVEGPIRGIAAAPTYLDITVPPHTAWRQPVPAGQAAFAYTLSGRGRFATSDGWREVEARRLVLFADGGVVEGHGDHEPFRLLLIAATPLHEPVARYGPFVMNTRDEILETIRDLQNGTFGR